MLGRRLHTTTPVQHNILKSGGWGRGQRRPAQEHKKQAMEQAQWGTHLDAAQALSMPADSSTLCMLHGVGQFLLHGPHDLQHHSPRQLSCHCPAQQNGEH